MPPLTMTKHAAVRPHGATVGGTDTSYATQLDKSHVRVVETFNEITSKVSRASRRRFQQTHKLESASPARWPFEELMAACVEFGIHPTLGKAGLEFVTESLGRDSSDLKSEYLESSDTEETQVDEDEPMADDEDWYNEFFGLNKEPRKAALQLHVDSETPSVLPETELPTTADGKSIFAPVVLDEDFHIAESVKKLLRVVDKMSATRIVNVAMTGPTGCGKTSTPEWFAAKTGRPLFIADMPTFREAKEVLGYKDLQKDEDGTQKIVWQKSGLVQALETKGAIVVLDEVTRIHGSVTNSVLPLLDHRKRVWLDDIQDTVTIADGVIIFFTANIGSSYTGTWQWDAAFENRIDYRIDVDYLPPKQEAEVLTKKTGIDAKIAKAFTEIAQIIRQRAQDPNDALPKAVSTRQLLSAAAGVNQGLTALEALEFTVIPTFSSEGGNESDRAHVLQIVQGKLAA